MSGDRSKSVDTRSKAKPDPSCQRCVKMLQEILAAGATRPRQIVQALNNNNTTQQVVWRPTANGLEVQIPVATSLPQRKWTDIQPMSTKQLQQQQQDKQPDDQKLLLPSAMLQATSAAAAAEADKTSVAASASEARTGYEWMRIECKPCANSGPEAGARAFVMGPTPLSMVVCTNRLQNYNNNQQHNNKPTTTTAARDEMEEILTHEFMHVYDVRRLELDLRACQNLAYSEIRAAKMAECATSWTPQTCTRLKAQTATQNLFGENSAWCIRQVWEKAYQDTRPFADSSSSSSSATPTAKQPPSS